MTEQKQCRYEGSFKDKPLILETGFLARQATSSVLATYGETKVLASVVVGPKAPLDYLPLQVIYEERLYATGKIKGSRFIKREGKPTDNAVLTGRLIDRSLRSLFNQNIRNNIQVIITVLSVDEINSPDTLSVLAASAALSLCSYQTDDGDLSSQELFAGPVSSVRVGLKTHSFGENIIPQIESITRSATSFDELIKPLEEVSAILDSSSVEDQEHIRNVFNILNSKNPQWATRFRELEKNTSKLSQSQITEKYNLVPNFMIQPSYDEMKLSQLDLVVSGSESSVTMIEAGAQVISESILTSALEIAQNQLGTLTSIQESFIEEYNKTNPQKVVPISVLMPSSAYYEYWSNRRAEIESLLYSELSKTERNNELSELLNSHIEQKQEEEEFDKNLFSKAYQQVYKEIVQSNIIRNKRRLDGRQLDEVREITCIPALLPRTHGSSIFQRGETQVLNILTLGTNRDAQILDGMEDFEEQTKRYIHHYNFPAYSVGEIGRYYGPGRREIGHGALAEKALIPVLPSQEQFPYTMRLVSECLGSNGSTSMASTCASCLSLMDGGVPIKQMVAGIAMGVIIDKSTDEYAILTDIQGAEDHYGDMDFKVAGTETGITALQLDNKVQGLKIQVIFDALKEALKGRLHILTIMKQAIDSPRSDISQYAPRVLIITVPAEKIGEVIGPSGKIIKSIIQKYEVEIDIEDVTGKTFIYGKDSEKVEAAKNYINNLIKGYEIGDVVEGKVFRVENYGAFVRIDGTDKEGLIHISEIANRRITKVTDVLNINDTVKAKIIDINDKGKISLSIRKLDSQEPSPEQG
jgi:polyribonucleotide nucleotidyltransferase